MAAPAYSRELLSLLEDRGLLPLRLLLLLTFSHSNPHYHQSSSIPTTTNPPPLADPPQPLSIDTNAQWITARISPPALAVGGSDFGPSSRSWFANLEASLFDLGRRISDYIYSYAARSDNVSAALGGLRDGLIGLRSRASGPGSDGGEGSEKFMAEELVVLTKEVVRVEMVQAYAVMLEPSTRELLALVQLR